MIRGSEPVSVTVFLLVIAATGLRAAEPATLPATGVAVPEMASFDRRISELMRKWEIPGGAVAVAKDGRLVLARGYGLADVEKKQPVEPDALFRIASVSKPITAAAVLVLVERGQLKLDAKAVDWLGSIKPLEGKSIDPGFRKITVRQLLHHTGGFDRAASFDPMFGPAPMVKALGTPADGTAIVRFMLSRPLDFRPGTRYVYSNFGYCLLGRIIEHVTGKPYEASVQALVLQPAGITRMRLGRTRLADLATREVHYYPPPGAKPVNSVFPDVKEPVPSPYGGYYLEAMDAHGGWIASAIDLVRFTTWLDGSRKPGLLEPRTVRLIGSRPAKPVSADKPVYYGLGWLVHTGRDGANWSHAGGLPGTQSLLVRTHHGLVLAAVFNFRPRDGDNFLLELDGAFWKAVGEVKNWPQHDFFGRYP